MFKKVTSAISSLTGTPSTTLPPSHTAPARAKDHYDLARELLACGVPTSTDDCITCEAPCEDSSGPNAQVGSVWNGKAYSEYVMDRYGDLGELPEGFDTDWETALAGSAKGGTGRIVVVSTGKSDWVRDHTDEEDSFSHHLDRYIAKLPPTPAPPKNKGEKGGKQDFNVRGPANTFIAPAALPPPGTTTQPEYIPPPSIYSSSLITQSDDPEDQTVIVFPDWKVCLEVENSKAGAKGMWEGVMDGKLGRAGRGLISEGGTERRRSWVLPYRAVVLLCSHKRRDKRCSIAAPLLRSALHTVLAKHSIHIDETGGSLSMLEGDALETLPGTAEEKEAWVGRKIEDIPGVHGGEGGEVGIFNINHLGGHRYAGVMLILFPSGAYVSHGRVTPQEIPRVVEDTILQGKIVPGLLRNAVGVTRTGQAGKGFLSW